LAICGAGWHQPMLGLLGSPETPETLETPIGEKLLNPT
jgi:hypothetical protein